MHIKYTSEVFLWFRFLTPAAAIAPPPYCHICYAPPSNNQTHSHGHLSVSKFPLTAANSYSVLSSPISIYFVRYRISYSPISYGPRSLSSSSSSLSLAVVVVLHIVTVLCVVRCCCCRCVCVCVYNLCTKCHNILQTAACDRDTYTHVIV